MKIVIMVVLEKTSNLANVGLEMTNDEWEFSTSCMVMEEIDIWMPLALVSSSCTNKYFNLFLFLEIGLSCIIT